MHIYEQKKFYFNSVIKKNCLKLEIFSLQILQYFYTNLSQYWYLNDSPQFHSQVNVLRINTFSWVNVFFVLQNILKLFHNLSGIGNLLTGGRSGEKAA